MARQTDERKAWTHLSNNLKAIDWNPQAFAICVQYAHPAIQNALMETMMQIIDVWAEECARSAAPNGMQTTTEVAYEIRNLVRSLMDTSTPKF